jgi:hypothetical protein
MNRGCIRQLPGKAKPPGTSPEPKITTPTCESGCHLVFMRQVAPQFYVLSGRLLAPFYLSCRTGNCHKAGRRGSLLPHLCAR